MEVVSVNVLFLQSIEQLTSDVRCTIQGIMCLFVGLGTRPLSVRTNPSGIRETKCNQQAIARMSILFLF